ncbi:MAG: phosphoadenylyl-sulfate reductase [Actinomycetota bacterium]|nr:phosphoadenylyl-sulfate reductase [Actinomycetota bacterium]
MTEVPAGSRRLGDDELAAVSERLEALPVLEAATGAVGWAIERYGGSISVASSFQDVVLVDLVRKARADVEIIFLDTEFHFPETLAFVERLRRIWDLSLTTTHPSVGLDEFPCGSPRCCEVRKVQPLARVLEGRAAWITGLKRVDTPERADAPIVAWDAARHMVKVNPLAGWSDRDVEDYLGAEGLPHHPLTYVGYVSIGCAPTTQPVAEGQNPREGRWPGTGKTECGLHV